MQAMSSPPDEGVFPTIPERCQRLGCVAPVETFCPLCERFFCAEHDELVPVRRHDCVRGRAET
jgi:hypothetical protein